MPLTRHVVQFEGQVRTLAEMDVGKMWDRLLGEFLAEWERLDRQRLSAEAIDAELTKFLDDLSEKPMVDLARTGSGVSYNQGRSAELLTAVEDGRAQFVVRSEVLDSRTCQSCAGLDGMVQEIGTPDFHQFMPPALCDGGDRCRGIYVAIGAGA